MMYKIKRTLKRHIPAFLKWIKRLIYGFLEKIIFGISNFLEDILIFSGLTCIVIATFLLSKIAGIYVLGIALLGLGIYFTKCPLRKE